MSTHSHLILLILCYAIVTNGFMLSVHYSSSIKQQFHHDHYHYSTIITSSSNADDGDGRAGEDDIILTSLSPDISHDVRSVAETLWGSPESLGSVLMSQTDDHTIINDEENITNNVIVCHPNHQGEMPLPSSIPISQRFSYFEQQAQHAADPRAQHSVGLLLWNGFTSTSEQTSIDSEASARWHAAAAVQGNLDALAVLGGCLRTGTGVGKCKNIALGLRCIEYAASVGNPSGVNKKGAMMESNDDYIGAMKLYRECFQDESKRTNALLLFNLGYCLIHGGEGVGDHGDGDVQEGEKLWRDAVALAPDEGSEEAAWFLYQQYSERGELIEARRYLDTAADLGLEDAVATSKEARQL